MAQIRAHPAVERAIPVTTVSPLALVVPFIRDDSPLETYGVMPEDMAYLVELYGLELAEGYLPRAGTNEIVIPWTAARNRDLGVGDVIGDPERPIYPDAPTLPAALVVSGIFAPAGNRDEDVWLSLMSQAFFEDNRDVWNAARSLIIIRFDGAAGGVYTDPPTKSIIRGTSLRSQTCKKATAMVCS